MKFEIKIQCYLHYHIPRLEIEESRVLCMLNMHSTTKLHTLSLNEIDVDKNLAKYIRAILKKKL